MKQKKIVRCTVAALLLLCTVIGGTPVFAYSLENHYVANKATQYAWGANMQSDSGIIKNGWLAGVSAWNSEGVNIGYNSISKNILKMECPLSHLTQRVALQLSNLLAT